MFTSTPPICTGRALELSRKDSNIRYLRHLGNSDIAAFITDLLLNRFQAVLHADGTIVLSYDKIFVKDGIVGVFTISSNEQVLVTLTDPEDPETHAHLDLLSVTFSLIGSRSIRIAFRTRGAVLPEGDPSVNFMAISEFPKWRKYLILLSFLDNSSARPVQIGGVDVNICHSRSTAVRGRRRSSSQSPPRGPFCRTRTGPVEADGAVDAQNAPTAPWKTLCVFHELPQGLSHQVTHEKLRKAPKYRWETRIDPTS